jgi:hypothetical protein
MVAIMTGVGICVALAATKAGLELVVELLSQQSDVAPE